MNQEAVELFQVLVEAGAFPGEDFSCNPKNGTYQLNERTYELLKQRYPEIDWDSISKIVERDFSEAVEAIQTHLGVNFVERILDLISCRLQELPPNKATWYLRQVLNGVEYKTGVPLYSLLIDKLDPSLHSYVENLLAQEAEEEPCDRWIGDLVLAAGGSEDEFELQGDEVLLTEQGMRLLASVWSGEPDLYGELAKGSS